MTALVLGLCLIVQCMMHFAVIGFYELNKSYIAKNLCENKDKPQMKCCGKCYLRKQLKKGYEQENPSKGAPTKVEKNEVVAFILPISLPPNHYRIVLPTPTLRTPVYQHLYHSTIPVSIFHPPSISC
jgi:hypothetical protein